MNSSSKSLKPFIKWVGGKGHLLNEIRKKYPSDLGFGTNKYIEPFVGGGAVLFDILGHYKLEEVTINDINPKLINCFLQVRDNPHALINTLSDYEAFYRSLSPEMQKTFFYTKREQFNSISCSDSIESAALFIMLNKTCFNGLYRENSSGHFNVPFGSYTSPTICDADNILSCSKVLQGVMIQTGDYSEVLKKVDSKTFVYIDPPYRPISQTAAFTAYHNAALFDDQEQIRLAKEISNCIDLNAKVLISNSDPKNTDENDDFFDSLYNKRMIERIPVMRFINGKEKKTVSELLITSKYD